jgi:cell division protein FtsI (penicillin-binding protein 3)
MSRRPLEDRLPPWRRRLVLLVWLSASVVICLRAAQIQIAEGATWQDLAEAQHQQDAVVPAARGSILDRDGTPLAVTRERIRVSVAPKELSDVEAVRSLLRETLGLSRGSVVRLTSRDRVWAVAPDLYAPIVREQLRGVPGIHLETIMERYHPHGDLARGVLGGLQDDEGFGGVEAAFEELLGGTPGREVIARDNRGREIPGERLVMTPPRAGGEVVLTLDMDLQEIAQEALEDAIDQTDARGGDVVITDPMTGEVLALVSVRDGKTLALSAINTPHEPGSTIKPFTVAGLLQHGLASLDDTVDVGNGRWEIDGRRINDTHTEGRISIATALRESSNIGIAMAAEAYTPGLQYETLRDFGFGNLTGIELPGEAAGTLRRPDRWTAMSDESLAIGYELSTTPLQLAMAYGALANGGVLMQPRLIRETRGSDGRVIERFGSQEVRRVISRDVAEQVSRALIDVVEDGTGTSARMANFQVAGKTGTAWLDSGEGYERGAYYSSFAGFFPAERPQLVVFVGLDAPQGTYYGGAVAAPVTRATMEAALAARATPLDRGELLRSTRRQPVTPSARLTSTFVARTGPAPAAERAQVRDPSAGVSLPDVSGLPARVAVRRLHALGLRVAPSGAGTIRTMRPPAGSRVLPGDTIQLRLSATD